MASFNYNKWDNLDTDSDSDGGGGGSGAAAAEGGEGIQIPTSWAEASAMAASGNPGKAATKKPKPAAAAAPRKKKQAAAPSPDEDELLRALEGLEGGDDDTGSDSGEPAPAPEEEVDDPDVLWAKLTSAQRDDLKALEAKVSKGCGGQPLGRVRGMMAHALLGTFVKPRETERGTVTCPSRIQGLKPLDYGFVPNSTVGGWVAKLEEGTHVIKSEFEIVRDMADLDKMGLWSLAARPDCGEHYAPEWRVLNLFSGGVWQRVVSESIFGATCGLIKTLDPDKEFIKEVFFARMPAGSVIQPHSDQSNWSWTLHLPLIVEEGKCWLQVGNEKRYWKQGKAWAFYHCMEHQAKNESKTDRIILIIRTWHPGMKANEKAAMASLLSGKGKANVKM